MHTYDLSAWQHDHDFVHQHDHAERRTMFVMILTFAMMIGEIVAGTAFGSMALLADGWHMGTHVAAFAIALFAYAYARRHADNPLYSFGSGKVSVLGGFASATALAVIALIMVLESVHRMFESRDILFNEAIAVAVIGLIVNIISAVLLQHPHADNQHHHDHNLRAAYLHVLADAITSVLAIVALLTGKWLGWQWMDPLMGIVGSVIIGRWSYGLIRDTSSILLDAANDTELRSAIRHAIESEDDERICDLHTWDIASGQKAAIIAIVAHSPKTPEDYKQRIAGVYPFAHVTVEIHRCPGDKLPNEKPVCGGIVAAC